MTASAAERTIAQRDRIREADPERRVGCIEGAFRITGPPARRMQNREPKGDMPVNPARRDRRICVNSSVFRGAAPSRSGVLRARTSGRREHQKVIRFLETEGWIPGA
jgi:hypothetical protein